jgi:hypothetical protein
MKEVQVQYTHLWERSARSQLKNAKRALEGLWHQLQRRLDVIEPTDVKRIRYSFEELS